ncbi:MAG TPA: hypothetical protein PLO53_06850 [Candidatus Hydrogenedentes bacterium]|nr:hypothetical protein [Candidatus Hydrogenedentota bacterium]HPU97658.1 hypothetical protein [Candidatus Hydrogenedentota bacterium]
MITQCCVCKKVHAPEGWQNLTPARLAAMNGPISHGYCPECLAKALADIESLVNPTAAHQEKKETAAIPLLAAIPGAVR